MSDRRIRQSGHFYRAQKRQREDENKTQGNELRRMLFPGSSSQNTSESLDTTNDNQNLASNQSPIQSNEISNTDQNATENIQVLLFFFENLVVICISYFGRQNENLHRAAQRPGSAPRRHISFFFFSKQNVIHSSCAYGMGDKICF